LNDRQHMKRVKVAFCGPNYCCTKGFRFIKFPGLI